MLGKNVYCGPPCGKVCFPFKHTGFLTFTWTDGDESCVYSQVFDGDVCIPFFFKDEGRTDINIEGIEIEGFDFFFVVGVPDYLSQEEKDDLYSLCGDDIEALITGISQMTYS